MEFSKFQRRFSLLLLVVVVDAARALAEPRVPCFFVFGDSLVDNGNNNRRNTTSRADFLPYGIDFPAGPTGRFNNGRNIADFIAELLGFEDYIPPFANAVAGGDILRGVNYGSGGAGILDETGRRQFGDVIGLNEQLSNHGVVISWIAELMGSEIAAKEYLSRCIYYVGMGNNDYLNNYLPEFYSSDSPHSPHQFAALLTQHYSDQLRKLYDYGARKVAVPALGKLGCVPHELSVYTNYMNISTSCIETSNDVVQLFDENLELVISRLNDHLTDAEFIYTSDPKHAPTGSDHGNFSIWKVPCCPEEGVGECVAGSIPCKNRDEYMFWDAYHPTEAANLVSAKNVYHDMSPLHASSDPIDIL